MTVHQRLAGNVRRVAEHSAQRHRSAHIGTIQHVDPFWIELHDLPHLLVEGRDDFAVSQWVRFYHKTYGVQIGDNALVDERHGVYVWADVLSGTEV